MDISNIIRTLQFLKQHVFTAENIQHASALGKSLGEVLAEAYEFANDMLELSEGATRSLELDRQLRKGDLLEIVDELQR